MSITMAVLDWLHLLGHFLTLSLLAIGGAITTAPDMHRYLVVEQHWLTDSQFTASIALAQAAPGPNVLFIALLGWNVGLNAAGGLAAGAVAWGWGVLGACVTMAGILIPSTTLTLAAARWGHKNRERLGVRAFKTGMAPIVIALLGATGWILSASQGSATDNWRLWLLTAVVTVLVWRTRIHLLWLLAAGGLLGWWGLV
ncbi:chromate transporter [Rhodoferax lacus]|uniref:Chromate transporter n=1 Tax=Rhodoferax lacus TaxID=2184758 RepID=A0A3E1RGM3_9BURK|nr:chromate transporter [Rhodoferax lacus]RFO98509.1 chromate transporter [Rhodoferax lacus]